MNLLNLSSIFLNVNHNFFSNSSTVDMEVETKYIKQKVYYGSCRSVIFFKKKSYFGDRKGVKINL